MTLAKEDRDAAIEAVIQGNRISHLLATLPFSAEELKLASRTVDALAEHGWGPKATVRIDRVAECIAEACDVGPATGYRMLTGHLRERGIGLVTE